MIVDLVESSLWLNDQTQWPGWLNKTWLRENKARLICRLSQPEDISALRALVPEPDCLLAYPCYQHLEQELSETELEKVHHTFMRCLGSDRYVTLLPDSSQSNCPEPMAISEISERDPDGVKTLALVTPMPPTASGIASYCAEILPELARYYNVTLVVEDADRIEPSFSSKFQVIDYSQLLQNGAQFDRIMYHFGNSGLHYDYFTLLHAHPGLVVLHDIYLGDCIFASFKQLGQAGLRQQIYVSHGWSALTDCECPVKQMIELYPACASVFLDSFGVVVHNRFAHERLPLFFGQETLAHLSRTSHARKIRDLPDRVDARRHLKIPTGTRVYSSFGMLVPNKCLDEIIDAWGRSELAQDPGVVICLVGGCTDHILEEQLMRRVNSLPNPEQVIFTGFVESSTYDAYIAATDIAIQLRRNSRGESSGALLDCMAAGVPTIVNAHGSSAEMPEETVVMLDDDFRVDELASAFQLTLEAPEKTSEIGEAAQRYVRDNLSLEKIVSEYHEITESSYKDALKSLPDKLQQELFCSKLGQGASITSLTAAIREFDDLMSCTAQHTVTLAGTQLLVDISGLVNSTEDAATGEVTTEILKKLLHNFCLGPRVEPIYYDPDAQHFRYARSYINMFLELFPLFISDDIVEARPGDIYLGLCSALEEKVSRQRVQLWRGRGVRSLQLLSGRLPATALNKRDDVTISLDDSLLSITETADGVIMLNRSEADSYSAWLDQNTAELTQQPGVGYLHPSTDSEIEPRVDESLPYNSVLPIRWIRTPCR